jgi:signal transduction histidine kinase
VATLRRFADRARGWDPFRVDAVVAILFAVASGVEAAAQSSHLEQPVLTVALLTAMMLALAWRRRWPIAVASWNLAVLSVAEVTGASEPNFTFPFLAILLANYSVGADAGWREFRAGAALVLFLACLAIAVDPTTTFNLSNVLFASVFIAGLPMAAGRALRNRRLLTRELRSKARRLEREREERARQAVLDERQRVARELHDVVAHSVSVMVIQAGAARRVARRDRKQAREALDAVETTGRQALAEMRRMVGVLRKGDEKLALAPQPSLAQLGTLVERARAAGLPVEVRVEGAAAGEALPPGVDLAAYRVVQEALTNTIKHAGAARAVVHVRYAADAVEVEVSDNGSGPSTVRNGDGSGHGLVGMGERLALYGGELRAGGAPGGGFSVCARIPLTAVAA